MLKDNKPYCPNCNKYAEKEEGNPYNTYRCPGCGDGFYENGNLKFHTIISNNVPRVMQFSSKKEYEGKCIAIF